MLIWIDLQIDVLQPKVSTDCPISSSYNWHSKRRWPGWTTAWSPIVRFENGSKCTVYIQWLYPTRLWWNSDFLIHVRWKFNHSCFETSLWYNNIAIHVYNLCNQCLAISWDTIVINYGFSISKNGHSQWSKCFWLILHSNINFSV